MQKDEINKKGLNQLFVLGVAVDKCNIGIHSLLHGNTEYDALINKLSISRFATKKGDGIRKLRELSYSLNSMLLAIHYLRYEGAKIAPDYKLPWYLFPENSFLRKIA